MSVRALVSAIETDPVKQEQSYTLMKEALLVSYGKTKWQMAYALLDHPDLGDRRPSAMMAEMLALRFETSAPDSLFFALFHRRLPAAIHDHLAAANHETAAAMVSAVSETLSAVSLRSASPHRRSPDRRAKSPDRRARSPDRRQDRGQKRHPTPGRQDGRQTGAGSKICRNHRIFGAKTWNCRGNCEFSEN